MNDGRKVPAPCSKKLFHNCLRNLENSPYVASDADLRARDAENRLKLAELKAKELAAENRCAQQVACNAKLEEGIVDREQQLAEVAAENGRLEVRVVTDPGPFFRPDPDPPVNRRNF